MFFVQIRWNLQFEVVTGCGSFTIIFRHFQAMKQKKMTFFVLSSLKISKVEVGLAILVRQFKGMN